MSVGSGRVEEDEFLNFLIDLKSTYEKSISVESERHFLYVAEVTPVAPPNAKIKVRCCVM